MMKFIKTLFLLMMFPFVLGAAEAGIAEASLTAPSMKNLKANITFEESNGGVKVISRVTGLGPNSVHAIHVHENGVCEKPKFESAGDHFNPHHKKHGSPSEDNRHLGDLGNLKANARGVAQHELFFQGVSKADFAALIGKAVIIHAKNDDLKSQPAGDSGDRIACGLISSSL